MRHSKWLATFLATLVALAGLLCASSLRADDLFVSSEGTNQVLRFDTATSLFKDVFVSAGSGGLSGPLGLAFGPDGNLYVASHDFVLGIDRILRYNGTTGAFIDIFVDGGNLDRPRDITFGADGNLYVSNQAFVVLAYRGTDGTFLGFFVSFGSGGLSSPFGIAFGPDGRFYVSNTFEFINGSILRYNGTNGTFIDAFVPAGSGGLSAPTGIAFGHDGNLYVSNAGTSSILRYNGANGAFMGTFASLGVALPVGLTFGPDGDLYVADSANNAIVRFNGSNGSFVHTLTGGGLNSPTFLTFKRVAVGVINATSKVHITRSAFTFNFSTNNYVQRVIIKNISTAPISGPISLVLDSLSSNASLASSNGSTTANAPLGSPYVNFTLSGTSLAPGNAAAVVLSFVDPSNATISYTPRILAGVGTR